MCSKVRITRLQLHSTPLTLAANNGVFAPTHLRHMCASIPTAIPNRSIHVRYLRRRESHNFRANTNVRRAHVSVAHRADSSHVRKSGKRITRRRERSKNNINHKNFNSSSKWNVNVVHPLTSLVSYSSMQAIM